MKSNQATKPTLPTSLPAPGNRQTPDDDETAPPVSPSKTTFLPTGLSRAIVLSSILFTITAGAVGLLSNRYSLIAIPSSPNAMAYRLDRLTGSVAFCSSVQCAPMPAKLDKSN